MSKEGDPAHITGIGNDIQGSRPKHPWTPGDDELAWEWIDRTQLDLEGALDYARVEVNPVHEETIQQYKPREDESAWQWGERIHFDIQASLAPMSRDEQLRVDKEHIASVLRTRYALAWKRAWEKRFPEESGPIAKHEADDSPPLGGTPVKE